MTGTIAILVLLSALLHPFWNLLLKRHDNTDLAYVGLTVMMSLFGLFHALFVGNDLFAVDQVLPLLGLSLLGQVLYGTCLTATLRRGDLSAYYPIIRSSPVLIVVIGVSVLGRSYQPIVIAGIVLAVSGGFILLYRRGTHMLADPGTALLALLAMSGTAIYSLADSELMRQIPPQVMMFWIEGLLTPFFIIKYLLIGRHNNDIIRRPGRGPHRSPVDFARQATALLLPGVIAYISYYLILYAYQLGGDVAAVTTVRQASIPVSVLLGGYYLREGAILRRLIASLILATGIIIIVLYG